MEKNEKNKGIKGITLIALVITIIVLLILAGISITMLTGNNSILNQATNASRETTHKNVLEQMQLNVYAYTTERTTGKYSNSLIDYLKGKYIISDISGEEDKWLINVTTLLGSNQSMGKGTYPNDVYVLEKQATSTGSIVNTKVAATIPIRIAATTTSQVIYKVVYYGNDTSEVISLGTITSENNSNKNDLAKLITDFKNMNEGELDGVLNSENDYEIMTITDYDENDYRYYYIKYNGKRYKITVFNGDSVSLVDSIEEYTEPIKDVTYAITSEVKVMETNEFSENIYEYIDNRYELEEMEFVSDDESVVTIDSKGDMYGVKIGTTTITIKGVESKKTKVINVEVISSGVG